MKSTYFIALYLLAIGLLAFLFYLSIGTAAAEESDEGGGIRIGEYVISSWGLVIGALGLIMTLVYFQVRKKFRRRFPKSKTFNKKL
ncbi:MAG: hypothetical protein AB3N14_17000 [Flavobacteriaceae bacterium]